VSGTPELTKEEVTHVFLEAWGITADGWLFDDDIPEEQVEEVRLQYSGFLLKVNEWLASGRGVAVYENHDLGVAAVGHKRFFSYGTEDSSLPDPPPVRLPDFPGEINWRYQLIGTYRGEQL
jgi:hypothetical protein